MLNVGFRSVVINLNLHSPTIGTKLHEYNTELPFGNKILTKDSVLCPFLTVGIGPRGHKNMRLKFLDLNTTRC